MTLVEFIHPLKGSPIRDICLAALYFEKRYSGKDQVTVEDLRDLLKRAHIPKVSKLNLADTLSRSAPYVDVAGKSGNRFLWAITSSGEQRIRSMLGLPEADIEIEHDVSGLARVVASIADSEVASYVKESITCLSAGALRASVVFLWAGAVREVQKRVMQCDKPNVNAAVQKYDNKARQIKQVDDLSYLKESTLLLVAQEIGLFDKNERSVLEDALDLRNKCGHPGKYSPGPKKVSGFIEDVVGILFS
jgi:hypothetical protein